MNALLSFFKIRKVLFILLLSSILMIFGVSCGGKKEGKEDTEYIEGIENDTQLSIDNAITSIPENSSYYYEEENVNRDIPEALAYMNIGQPYFDFDRDILVVPDNNIFDLSLKDMEKATNVEKEEMEDFYWIYYTEDEQYSHLNCFLSLYYNAWHMLERVELSYEYNDWCYSYTDYEYQDLFFYVDYYGEDYGITEDGNFIWEVNGQEICLEWNYEGMCPRNVSIRKLE